MNKNSILTGGSVGLAVVGLKVGAAPERIVEQCMMLAQNKQRKRKVV